MSNTETILIVDDNEDLRFNLSNIVQSENYNVLTAGEGKTAIRIVKEKSPDLVLLDMRLPGMDGMTILEEIKKIDNNIIVIMLTAFGEVRGAVKAMKLGAFDYITKPFDNEELIIIIKKALNTSSLSKEVQSLRKQLNEKKLLDEVIGQSPEFKQVLKQVQIIAPTTMTVMIQGESGTGKEVICNLIHKLSERSDKQLVAIDCGAIPDTLVESEFFGHEKGAFTGADAPKTGKFEQAHGGTLFLDELTNLTEANQMKLLRVIEERKIQRLGGKKIIDVDVRIIAAANIKLSDAVNEGNFRSDLYYRLNEFHIDIPLLKDRKDDIPILAKYFMDKANGELNKNAKGFSPEASKIMLNYNWPGNVRELKNVIKRAVLLSETELICPDSLSIKVPNQDTNNIDVSEDENSLHGATKQVERELIKKALEQTEGNKIQAAKLLQMNRKTLYRKIKNLGL
ncbi:MAG: sigma-54-dependent Fis family transcriptional regulator [Ignavibacteriae bacterium]|nr:MAG: sigma-54-dependent Fis family transcriptional regulator [Ignavibacteriota bacterium]